LKGSKHVENVESWGQKPYAQFICHLCSDSMENEPMLLRNHFRSKHSTASSATAILPVVKIWHCDSCNLDMSADADTVRAHNQSQGHQRQHAYDGNASRPDGSALADATRQLNGSEQEGQIWITVTKKDGSSKKKLVKAAKKSGNAGVKNDNNFMICCLCYGHVIVSMQEKQLRLLARASQKRRTEAVRMICAGIKMSM
jgi:hypothetical protein